MNNINLNKTDSFKKTHTKSNKKLTDIFKKYLNRVNSNIDRDVKNFSARIKSFFNSILKSNTSKYTTYTQQTPVYTQYTQYMYSHPTPTISYEKMRYNQLKSSDVLISDLKAHPEDFNLVKSDIKKTLEMRGFESRAAENITHGLLNDPKLQRLGKVDFSAKTLSNAAATYQSAFPGDLSFQRAYGMLRHLNPTLDELSRDPKEMNLVLVHNTLFISALKEGLPASESRDLVNNLLASSMKNERLATLEANVVNKTRRILCLKVLGLSADSSDQEVRKAYKKLVLKYHPDKIVNLNETELKQRLNLPESNSSSISQLKDKITAQFRTVDIAYKVLTDVK